MSVRIWHGVLLSHQSTNISSFANSSTWANCSHASSKWVGASPKSRDEFQLVVAPATRGAFRRDIADLRRPEKLIVVEIGVEIDDEIDRVARLDLERRHIERLLPVEQHGRRQHAVSAGDDPAADAVARRHLVRRRGLDAHLSSPRCRPAANGGVLEIVPRVAACGR